MFFNVKHNPSGPDIAERTTLGAEQKARRWETGRGYCVEARRDTEARQLVR